MTDLARILVVDDTPHNLKLLADLLSAKGYTVSTAASGREALAKLDAEPADLILLDVVMPEMSGYEVCRRLRDNPATAMLPVVLVTALDPGEERVKGLDAGADDFLTKPILRANPHLHGVLFDRPEVVAGARGLIEAEGLANRCECVGGDFFAAVPEGCDIYLLKWVLIGWDDEHAQVLLRNCHRAMSAQATLLIVESLIPPGNAPHLAKLLDVNMLVNFGGQVRTEAEYSALLATTGFSMIRTIPTATPQQYSVIEAKRWTRTTPWARPAPTSSGSAISPATFPCLTPTARPSTGRRAR
jgi:CheY-like chemotaxis protein